LFEATKQSYHRKALNPRTQQRVRRGWDFNLDHAIVITQSPTRSRCLSATMFKNFVWSFEKFTAFLEYVVEEGCAV